VNDKKQIKYLCWFCKTQVTEHKGVCRKCEKKIYCGPSPAWLRIEKALRHAAQPYYYQYH